MSHKEQFIEKHFEIVGKLTNENKDLKIKYNKSLDDLHNYRYESYRLKMRIRNLCKYFGIKN